MGASFFAIVGLSASGGNLVLRVHPHKHEGLGGGTDPQQLSNPRHTSWALRMDLGAVNDNFRI